MVPVVVKNSKQLLPPTGGLRLSPGVIEITILPPIATAGMHVKEVPVLKDTVWEKIRAGLE